MHLHVYIPKATSILARWIARGSGIVAYPFPPDPTQAKPDDVLLVYFEGNLHNAENLRRYGQRVRHAADRLVHRYPTVARLALRRDEFIKIGWYYYPEPLVNITDPLGLRNWLGHNNADLRTTDG